MKLVSDNSKHHYREIPGTVVPCPPLKKIQETACEELASKPPVLSVVFFIMGHRPHNNRTE